MARRSYKCPLRIDREQTVIMPRGATVSTTEERTAT